MTAPFGIFADTERHGPLPHLLLLLTVGTGMLDAVSYLRLGHVFVANMTGNVVFLGFAAAGATQVSVSASLLSIVAFLVGAFAGGRLGVSRGHHRGRLLAVGGVIKVVLVAAALGVVLYARGMLDTLTQDVVTALLAITMGIQNAIARRIGVPDLTTTVLTLTLTGLAADARWAGGTSPRWGVRALAVAAMLVGAFVGGALVLNVGVASALAAATLVLLANTAIAWQASSSPSRWASPT